jgi:hypothetical protein
VAVLIVANTWFSALPSELERVAREQHARPVREADLDEQLLPLPPAAPPTLAQQMHLLDELLASGSRQQTRTDGQGDES